jgi:acetoin utilization protein AcuB
MNIRDYMTRGAHSIGPKQTLAVAHRIMRDNHIRHLPVLEGGKLIGLVSERDLHLVETLQDVDPETVAVEDAMTEEPYFVGPDADLATVARTMAEQKYGSAVILYKGKLLGVFTTTDALRALADFAAARHLPSSR